MADQAPERDDGGVRLAAFAGLNNVERPENMRDGELAQAVNVDITRGGGIQRRGGRVARYSGSNLRCLWANRKMTLFVEGDVQKRLQNVSGTYVGTTVRSIGAGRDVCYTEVNEDAICSDGAALWGVRDGAQFSLTAGVVLQTQTSTGQRREEAFYRPLPGGHLLAYYKGCLWVANDRMVYRSRPQLYGYHNPAVDFVMLPSKPMMMCGLDDAIYFATADRHYVVTGGGEEAYVFSEKLDYGAPQSGFIKVPVSVISADLGDGMGAMWLSHKGFMLGLPNGTIINLTEKRIAVPQYDRAALLYRERNGLRQVVATAPSKGGVGSFAIGDSAEAEIRRNGVIIN